MSQSSALKKTPEGAERAAVKKRLRDSARAMVPGLRARIELLPRGVDTVYERQKSATD